MKKMFSLALALIMALALCVPAFAEDPAPTAPVEDYTITITPPTTFPGAGGDLDTDNESYNAYKIFDATYKGEVLAEDGKISYTIDSSSPFFDAIKAHTDWFVLTQVNGSSTYVVEATDAYKNSGAYVIQLADELKEIVDEKKLSADATGTKSGDNFELTVDDKGYYFITSTLGSSIVVDTLSDVTVMSKNYYPSLAKDVSTNQARFGETITYTLTITIPPTADKAIVVTDTMEDGLTFIKDSFTVPNGVVAANNGQVNTITIADPTAVGSLAIVTYTAYIDTADGEILDEQDDDADGIDTDGTNTNQAYLEYSEYKSVVVKADVESYEATFKKVDGATFEGLEDVTFKLTEGDGETEINVVKVEKGKYRVADETETDYATITTDANGEILIQGLGDGEYALVELTTLDGYNLLAGPAFFNIKGGNNYYAGDDTKDDLDDDNNIIINNSGTELPSTGGVGTTIFYVIGGVLMAGAAVLLVTKKKLANEQ